eukprot:gene10418-25195_t
MSAPSLSNRGSALAKQFLTELKASTSSRGNTPVKGGSKVEDDGRLRQSRLGLGAKPKPSTTASKIGGSVASKLGKALSKSRKRKAQDEDGGTPEPDYSDGDSEAEKEAASKGAKKKAAASTENPLDSLLDSASKKKRKKAKVKKSKKVAAAVAAVEARTAAAAPPANASASAGGGGGSGEGEAGVAGGEDVFAQFSENDFATNWGQPPAAATASSGTAAPSASGGKKDEKQKKKQEKQKQKKESTTVDVEAFGKWGDAVQGLSFPSSDLGGGPPVDDEAALDAERSKKTKKSRPKGPKGRRQATKMNKKKRQSTAGAANGTPSSSTPSSSSSSSSGAGTGFGDTTVQLHAEGSVKRKNPLFNIDREGTLGGETEADSSGRAVSKAGGSTTTKFVDGAAADSSTTDGAAADGETKGEQAKKKRKMFGWLKGKGSKTDVDDEGKGDSKKQQQPRKKRKKVRSKQKNLKRDTRAAHLKPTYMTPGSADYKQPKPSWRTKGGSLMKSVDAKSTPADVSSKGTSA